MQIIGVIIIRGSSKLHLWTQTQVSWENRV